ncbi:MAG TPA: AraC family transcriptional regulator [Cyclobacteriaceae bacterium]
MPIIRDVIYGAVARGADLNELCAKLNLSAYDLNDSDKRVDLKEAYLSWEYALKMTRDSLLGLHIGESTNPSIMGLVGHLMQSAPNLKDAFQSVCQYSEVATDMFQYKMIQRGEETVLQFESHPIWIATSPKSAQHATEQAMAGTLNAFYLLSGQPVYPSRTDFNHKRLSGLKEYERVFNSALNFSSKANELIFKRSQLELTVLSYDRSLFAVFDDLLKERKARKDENVRTQLRTIILNEFKGQIPSIEILAARLNFTVRSLQRKLKEEGISFRELSTRIRNEVSTQLLNSKTLKVKEVARLLGYSEASAFRRAAKKWRKGSVQIKSK